MSFFLLFIFVFAGLLAWICFHYTQFEQRIEARELVLQDNNGNI